MWTSGYRSYSAISHERGKYGIWQRQNEHIRGHLWHRHSVTANQVTMSLLHSDVSLATFYWYITQLVRFVSPVFVIMIKSWMNLIAEVRKTSIRVYCLKKELFPNSTYRSKEFTNKYNLCGRIRCFYGDIETADILINRVHRMPWLLKDTIDSEFMLA